MRIGSITKTFGAALTLRLDDLGVLDIEDPVAAHLPDLGIDDTVTIRDFLGHTSGIADPDPAQIIALFREDSGQRFEFQELISVADVPHQQPSSCRRVRLRQLRLPRPRRSHRSSSGHRRRHHPAHTHSRTRVAYAARFKASPTGRDDPHWRVRRDRIDVGGKITFRHHGRMFKIGVGRHLARTRIICLVKDLHIRIIDAATGEVLRTLELDTTRTYQPTGRPQGGPKRPRKPKHPNP